MRQDIMTQMAHDPNEVIAYLCNKGWVGHQTAFNFTRAQDHKRDLIAKLRTMSLVALNLENAIKRENSRFNLAMDKLRQARNYAQSTTTNDNVVNYIDSMIEELNQHPTDA